MINDTQHINLFEELKVCVIIPTYNNQNTIAAVINDVKNYTDRIIVVNDGSSDDTAEILKQFDDVVVIEYAENIGKGQAIRLGFNRALELGFDYVITIDADGQHFADDLPSFLQKLNENPKSLIVGSRNINAEGMPEKNTFANKFSNFWFKFETGTSLPDTQSGYRLYPVKLYRNTSFFTRKYEFEIEILVRSAWRNIPVIPIPIKVYYPQGDERVSHFRPLQDFTRISILNTVLVLITLFYIWPIKLFSYLTKNKFTDIVKEQITQHNEKPVKVASALGFGVFMGIVPIWGFQMLTAAFLAHLMRLNKVLVLVASNISVPLFIPFILYFSYKTGGVVLGKEGSLTSETITNLKNQILTGDFYDTLSELGYDFYQYIIGSLIFDYLYMIQREEDWYLLLVLFKKTSANT